MILPTKRLGIESSLLGVGADVLQLLNQPKTISRIWEEMKDVRQLLNYEERFNVCIGLYWHWISYSLRTQFLFMRGLLERKQP